MKPIKVKFKGSGKSGWGWWVDTSNREAIIVPIGVGNVSPINIPLPNIEVIEAQNPELDLSDPKI